MCKKKKQTEIYIEKNSKNPTCIICGQNVKEVIKNVFDTRFGINGEFSIGICSSCELIQTLPSFSQEKLKELYNTYYNFRNKDNHFYTRFRDWFIFSKLYSIWLMIDGDFTFHTIKGSGRLLDIGCNEGRGLKIFHRNGYCVEGVEINKNAAKIAQEQGYKVFSSLEECSKAGCLYDIVVLSNVLEHSSNPAKLLSSLYHILEPGGKVWISCPNYLSWIKVIAGRYWINWHVPFHVFHFTEEYLIKLLNNAGFYIIEKKQKTPSLWVAQTIISWLFSKKGYNTKQLRNPILHIFFMLLIRLFMFPFILIANAKGYGDCLIITGQKE